MKKFVLVLSFLFVPAVHAITMYQLFDKFGSFMDLFVSKGSLSEADEKLFNEIASTLGIADRKIKPRNAGLIMRLFCGYNNALAHPFGNRVYFNADCLEEMTEGQKRFLMGHELAHHQQHHILKRCALGILKYAVQEGIGMLVRPIEYKAQRVFDFQTLQFQDGLVDGYGDSPLAYRYFVEGFSVPGIEFSLAGLVEAQISQLQETEADEIAMQMSGTTLAEAVALLEHVYHPDTQNWPLYAKILAIINKFLLPIMALPIIKQHVPHLASLEERVKHLENFETSF